MVHVWKVSQLEEDVTSRSVHSFGSSTPINQLNMIHWTSSVAVAGQGGVRIVDLERSLQRASASAEDKARLAIEEDHTYMDIKLDDRNDEVTRCLNMVTPVSNGSHLLFSTT